MFGNSDSLNYDEPLPIFSGKNTAICKDGINANRNAIDYVIEEKSFTANDSLQIHLAPAGGFFGELKKM